MKITKYETRFARQYTVNLREEKLSEITVSMNQDFGGGDWRDPEINWAACGNQTIAQTQTFITGLEIAAALASCLRGNLPHNAVVDMLKYEFGATDEQIKFTFDS